MSVADRRIFGSPAFGVGVGQAALWVLLGVVLVQVVPSFDKLFQDFGTQLPLATMAVMRVSRFLVRYWYLGFLPVCLWPFVYWYVADRLLADRKRALLRRLWIVAAWLLPTAAVGLVAIGIVGTWATLIERLSQ